MKNLKGLKSILFVLFTLSYTVQLYSQMAAGRFKFVGNIAGTTPASDFISYWNQLTPENSGKWGVAEPTQGQFYWSQLDKMNSWCQQNAVPLKFHTFVWFMQQPTWISGLTTANQLAAVDNWYNVVKGRYPDVQFIDVVNEPTHNKPPYYLALGGTGVTGWDWLIASFQKARALYPNAILLINDYNVLKGTVLNSYINIITLLKNRNLVDGIGCQGHFLETTSATTIKSNLDKLAALNLPIYISEFDVVDTVDVGQLSKMQKLFPVFWTHPAVKGITFWGYLSNWQGKGGVLKNGTVERPALTWLKDYVSNAEKIAPSVPQNLRLERYSADTLLLKWRPSTDNVGVTGYEIYSGSRIVATVNAKDSTQKVYCPAAGTIPVYKIRAFDAAANASAFNQVASGVTELNELKNQDSSIDIIVSNINDRTFSIRFSGSQVANIFLTDVSGKIICKYSGVVSGQSLQLPAGLGKGMAILCVDIDRIKIHRKLTF
jgi:GH35 family endo-1,4-beta-xylanase